MISNGDQCSAAKPTESVEESAAKKDRKAQKRIEKTMEQTLAAANELSDGQQQLLFVCRKHAEAAEDAKQIISQLRKMEARVDQLLKEKTNLESEQSKALLTRSRLEGLCRELQKQNKLIKEESVARIREEEEKRREVSAKFQTTLSDITGTMNENNQKNTRLAEENVEMSKKLKSLCEQYEQNNTLVEKMMKQKELESQLAEARMAKLQLQMNEEKRQALQEKQTLLTDMSVYQKRCTDLQQVEVLLRQQLTTYTDKYEEIQAALAKSNQVFGSFKTDMEKMQKNIRSLEKETLSWRSRWEGSNRSLLLMAEQKQADDAKLLVQQKRIETLERLCRALQARGGAAAAAAAAGGELEPEAVGTERMADGSVTAAGANAPRAAGSAAVVQAAVAVAPAVEASRVTSATLPSQENGGVATVADQETGAADAPAPVSSCDNGDTAVILDSLRSLQLQLTAIEKLQPRTEESETVHSIVDSSTSPSAADNPATSHTGVDGVAITAPLEAAAVYTRPLSPRPDESSDRIATEAPSAVAAAAPSEAACGRMAPADSAAAAVGAEQSVPTQGGVSSSGDTGASGSIAGGQPDVSSEPKSEIDRSVHSGSPVT